MLVALCLGVVQPVASLRAEEGLAWFDSEIVRVGGVSVKEPLNEMRYCAGAPSLIEVDGEESFRVACVFGETGGERMARYNDDEGRYVYGFSYASDSKFYQLIDFCTDDAWCIFSQSENSALVRERNDSPLFRHYLVRDFSKHLVRDGTGAVRYRLSSGSRNPIGPGNGAASTRAVGVSTNGRWAVVEMSGYGALLVDIRSGEYRWAASLEHPWTGEYFDLTISNDGKWVAVAGWFDGIQLYAVTEECGYVGAYRRQGFEQQCRAIDVSLEALPPGYRHAQGLRFSPDSKKLTLVATTQTDYVRMTLMPKSRVAAGDSRYIAFGDSFTSGEGETADMFYLSSTNTSTNHCHVSTRSYPYLLGQFWSYRAESLACSGSRMPDVEQVRRSAFELPNPIVPTLVSLGIGGNDIDVMGKLKTCLGATTCDWAREEARVKSAAEIRAILPNLIGLIQRIQHDTATPMFLVGYPLVINPDFVAFCSPLVFAMLSHEERQYMNETVQYLNVILEAAAHFTDIAYVDIENALVGERLCDVSEKSMNAVRIGDDIAPISFLKDLKLIGAESFHPTPAGHVRIAHKIKTDLGVSLHQPPCRNCQSSLNSGEYWQGKAGDVLSDTRQMAGTFLEKTIALAGSPVSITFPTGTFAPGASIRFELHSTPELLETVTAKQDGSFEGAITIPQGKSGYHTMHAYSQTYSGEKIDIYETVYTGEKHSSEEVAAITSDTLDTQEHEPPFSFEASSVRQMDETEVLGAINEGDESNMPFVSRALLGITLNQVWFIVALIAVILGLIAILCLRRKV